MPSQIPTAVHDSILENLGVLGAQQYLSLKPEKKLFNLGLEMVSSVWTDRVFQGAEHLEAQV